MSMEQMDSLADLIALEILEEIKTGKYAQNQKLPSEVEIAGSLGVSRTVVRDGFAILEREGFISRKHGVGTLINRHVLAVKTRMDLEQEFLEMVKNTGKTAKISFVDVKEQRANTYVAEKLHLDINEELLSVTRIITADDVPVILCTDCFAKKMIIDTDYQLDELEAPIFQFLSKYCEVDIFMDLTEVKAVMADKVLADQLAVPIGSPVLNMEEVGFDFRGKPRLYSSEFYRDGAFNHVVLRKKI